MQTFMQNNTEGVASWSTAVQKAEIHNPPGKNKSQIAYMYEMCAFA
jgi:hypothetical protein